MSTFDDFIYVSEAPRHAAPPPRHPTNWPIAGSVTGDFFDNTKGLRQNTEGLIVQSIRKNHPNHHLTITPATNYIGLASSSDEITCTPSSVAPQSIIERYFAPPARRFGDDTKGTFMSNVSFGCFDYKFKGTEFLLYIVIGTENMYPAMYNYILTPIGPTATEPDIVLAQKKADELLSAAVNYSQECHEEVLVFDQGYWQKNKELYQNIQKSNWEDVILGKERKKAIINDVIGFFNSADRYAEFGVPWKRGVIFYGPPGNGKTISTKALMHDVSKRVSPTVNSLYVKTLSSWQGPEYSIREIFQKARQMAPCLLIFEDIDSLVSPGVRSYFLNEVDGLESNHGILMIGSTNHLDRLDPGIAKRPSRFDRKYFFDVPDLAERGQYAEYWRYKLRNNKKVVFPKVLCEKVAGITDGFSFAYMKEAFVAALLVIAGNGVEEEGKVRGSARGGGDELEGNVFWKELQVQVDNLKKEMDNEGDQSIDEGLLKGLHLGGAAAPLPLSEPVLRGMKLPVRGVAQPLGGHESGRGRAGASRGLEQLEHSVGQRQFESNNVMPGYQYYGS